MSYRALINTQVRRAFRLAKDLAVDGLLTKQSAAAFDFDTATVSTTSSDPIPTKVLDLEEVKTPRDSGIVSKIIICQLEEVGTFSSYSGISFGGFDWKFGDPIKSDGSIVITKVFRGVSANE